MSFTPNLSLVRCHKNYWSTENDDISFTGDPDFIPKNRKSYIKQIVSLLLLVACILNSQLVVDGIYFGIEGDHGLKIPEIDELYKMRHYYAEDGVPYKGIHIYLRHAAVLRAAIKTESFSKKGTLNVLNVGSGYGVFDRLLPRKGINFVGIEKVRMRIFTQKNGQMK